MTIGLLRTRIKEAEKVCSELEYEYEMKLRSHVFSNYEAMALFARYQLAANYHEHLKQRLERREESMRCDPYPDDAKVLRFQ